MADDVPGAYIPLPTGLHDPRHTAGRVFDRLAADYDAARPRYPDAAVARLGAECHLGPGSRVLEVGCGTGQATRAVAGFGCTIRCLEPGPNLAALAKRNLRSSPHFEVVVQSFESADEPPGSYDVVLSATAFHWVDPHVSYSKAAGLLRPGGHLALLTNVHAAGGTQDVISVDSRSLHARFAPEIGSWTFPSVEDIRQRATGGGDIAAVWSKVERKVGDAPTVDHLFEAPTVTTYPWLAMYDRDGYLDMLGTQSSYALMDHGRREQIVAALGDLIDERLGGTITKQYVCVLAIAEVQRPDALPAT